MAVQRLQALFAEYDESHQTRGNKVCHALGIPMIVVSLYGLLALVKLGPFDLGMAAFLGMSAFYFVLEWRLAILMLLAGAGCYMLGTFIPAWGLVTLFVVGWIFQFIGHGVFEKKRPAFLRNIPHLLIGPLWFVNDFARVVPRQQNV